jgi:hypothetical protein
LGGREATVGIFSHTRGIAKRFLRQIKFEFEQNEAAEGVVPGHPVGQPAQAVPKWSEDDGIVVKRKSNPAEATVEAWGVVDGQPIGKHFFILVYDDVVVPESVTSPDMMSKTSDMLALSFALGAEGGRRRFIGTGTTPTTPTRRSLTGDGQAAHPPVDQGRDGGR